MLSSLLPYRGSTMATKKFVLLFLASITAIVSSQYWPTVKPVYTPLEKLVEASNYFAISLHRNFASEGRNIFFSPFGISSSLTSLMHGARQKTAIEMNETLGYKSAKLQAEKLSSAYRELTEKINRTLDEYAFAIANGFFIQQDYHVNQSFQDDAQEIFGTEVKVVDFYRNGQKAVWDINEWVKQKTRNKIKRILERAESSTTMMLLNAVYIKPKWLTEFNASLTGPQYFFLNGIEDQLKKVPMMHQNKQKYRLANSYDFRALELPYANSSTSMWIMLPHKRDGLAEVEDALSTKTFHQINDSFDETEIEVFMPKLNVEFNQELNRVLQKMGMTRAFSLADANFGGISQRKDLAVSQVLHRAIIEVNEEGSEAASVTSTTLAVKSAAPSFKSLVPPFRVDHPFLFCIVERKTLMILFMGRVTEL